MRAARFLCAVLLLIAALLLVLPNTQAGRRMIESALNLATGGGVRIGRLDGRFPDALRAARIELRDAQGAWLTLEDVAVDWSPRAFLDGRIAVARLHAARLVVIRARLAAAPSPPADAAPLALPDAPWPIAVEVLEIDRLELPALPSLHVRARASATPGGHADLTASLVAGLATTRLDASRTGAALAVSLSHSEPAGGWLAAAAGLPDLGATDLSLTTDGPLNALATRLHVAAGPLRADATATLDLTRQRATATFAATAPAMQPAPDIGWQSLNLLATASGGANAMDGTLRLTIASPYARGLTADALSLDLSLRGSQGQDAYRLAFDGTLALPGVPAPLDRLLGVPTQLAGTAHFGAAGPVMDRLNVSNQAIDLTAAASLPGGQLATTATVHLPDIAALAPQFQGAVAVSLAANGPLGALAVTATAEGTLGTAGVATTPVTARVAAQTQSDAASATLDAAASFAGIPLTLRARAELAADGSLTATLLQADWASLHAEASGRLPVGDAMPLGEASLQIGRLDDLSGFLGTTPGGSLTATATLGAAGQVTARLLAEGVAGLRRISLEAEGTQDKLALRLEATGAGATLSSAGILDLPAQQLMLSRLTLAGAGETLALQSPARLRFGETVLIDGLRLASGPASLVVAGRIAPTFDLTATLADLPLALLAGLAEADIGAEGRLRATARLTGTTASPTGQLNLAGTGLRLRTLSDLPPATAEATVTVAGRRAEVRAQASLGAAKLTLAGSAPLSATGKLNLSGEGRIPLAVLDPLLAPDGRRARGLLSLSVTAAGTLAAPLLDATARLTGASLLDATSGLSLTGVEGVLHSDGTTLSIERLGGLAGAKGRFDVTGSTGLATGTPLTLQLAARNATILSADRLTVRLDAELAVAGTLGGTLAATGPITLQQVDIRIPDRLGSSLPTLTVRRRGEPPPPPPAPLPDITLDLAVSAPERVFIRGRGLDAELGGKLRVRGTLAAPVTEGGLTLKRGNFSLLGQRLTLTSGTVGLSPGSLDPTLEFAAETVSGSTTARLGMTGTASAPKIALTSSPELPQDEILSQLVLGRSKSQLSALQIASLAAGLASLADPGARLDPLERIRAGLGLDTLTTGANANGDPTLEAGRSIAPGVRLGVRQGTAGAGSQGTVQIELGHGLKLQGDVGTSQGATGASGGTAGSAGITWQFEY